MCPCLSRRGLFGTLGIALLVLTFGFAGCTSAPDPWKEAKPGQKHVLVTFPALYCLTQTVAGDDAYVLCCLTTQDPHEYQFDPIDGLKALGAHLIVYNGLELDDKFVEKLNARQRAPTLCVGKVLPENLLLGMGDDDDDEDHKKDDHKKDDDKKEARPAKEEHHHHGAHDPHVWLGPTRAIEITENIARKLSEIDPPHTADYRKRADQLKEQLTKLHEDGKKRFKAKQHQSVVTMHDSMGYFANDFGLKVAGTIQVKPGESIEGPRLAELEKLCRDKHVGVITYEPQFSKKAAELLQSNLKNRGADVKLVEFDPLETAPLAKDSVNPDPAYYLQKMKENIDNLAGALP
jgi:zinc transport system substrate-binding protein